MKLATGTVIDGRVEIPAEFVPEGAQVMILATEPGEPVRLSRAEEAELSEAMEQIDRGEYIDGQALLDDLRVRKLG
jgi:hypothetical protein